MDHVHPTQARVVERLRGMWNWLVFCQRGVQIEEGRLAGPVKVSVDIVRDIVIEDVNRCGGQPNWRYDGESESE